MPCKGCEERREWIEKNILKPAAERMPAWVRQALQQVKAEQRGDRKTHTEEDVTNS